MNAERIKRINWKRVLITAAVVTKISSCSMYVGDAIDFRSHYTTPLFDKIRGIEAEEGFADSGNLELRSIVNEDGFRESYLVSEGNETPINSRGYAIPLGTSELIAEILGETDKKPGSYNSIDRLSEDLELGLRYYSVKAKRLLQDLVR